MAKLYVRYERTIFAHPGSCKSALCGFVEEVSGSSYTALVDVDESFIASYMTKEGKVSLEGLRTLEIHEKLCCRHSESYSTPMGMKLLSWKTPRYFSTQGSIDISDVNGPWKSAKSRKLPKSLRPNDFERLDRLKLRKASRMKFVKKEKVSLSNPFALLSD